MRTSYSKQLRLDSVPIEQVTLNLESRDRIVSILLALQFVYADRELADQVVALIAADINGNSRTDTGRKGMEYWHICVLAAVRLGSDFTYDQLQDLAENHRHPMTTARPAMVITVEMILTRDEFLTPSTFTIAINPIIPEADQKISMSHNLPRYSPKASEITAGETTPVRNRITLMTLAKRRPNACEIYS